MHTRIMLLLPLSLSLSLCRPRVDISRDLKKKKMKTASLDDGLLEFGIGGSRAGRDATSRALRQAFPSSPLGWTHQSKPCAPSQQRCTPPPSPQLPSSPRPRAPPAARLAAPAEGRRRYAPQRSQPPLRPPSHRRTMQSRQGRNGWVTF